jgi:hypothetical protein
MLRTFIIKNINELTPGILIELIYGIIIVKIEKLKNLENLLNIL